MKTDWIAGFLGTWSTELTLGGTPPVYAHSSS